jgi:hypothetical protein
MKLKRLLIMKAFFLMLGACNRFYVTVINIHSKTKFSLNVNGFSYPSFAKDTKELIFQYQNERYHISKLLIDGEFASSSFPVIESEYSHLYPYFSEQANKVVYVSNGSGFYELWMSNIGGMNPQQLIY